MKEKADPCDIEHHICQAACSLILTEKHALQYCAAAPSTRISLISPSSLTRTTISLQPPPHPHKKNKKTQASLNWGRACVFLINYFNLIMHALWELQLDGCYTCEQTPWWKKKNAFSLWFTGHQYTRGHGQGWAAAAAGRLMSEPHLLALQFLGLQVQNWELAAAWQLLCPRSSSSAHRHTSG